MVEPSTERKHSNDERLKDGELSFDYMELKVHRALICEAAYVIKLCVKSIAQKKIATIWKYGTVLV